MYIFAYLVSSLCCSRRLRSQAKKIQQLLFRPSYLPFENQLTDKKFCVTVLFADRTLITDRTNVVNTYVRVYI